jgi:hypothetical protein
VQGDARQIGGDKFHPIFEADGPNDHTRFHYRIDLLSAGTLAAGFRYRVSSPKKETLLMRAILTTAFVAATAIGGFFATEAQARFYTPHLTAPSLVEEAACVTRRERVVRPNGRVVYRTVRRCGVPPAMRGCRTIRERVVRPNGSVVYRTVRRCR